MQEAIDAEVMKQIVEILVPTLPNGASEDARNAFINTYNKMEQKVVNGELDETKITIEVAKKLELGSLIATFQWI